MNDFKLPLTETEYNACPIGETIHVITKAKAADLLNHPLEELEHSFINFLHVELLHHLFQRCTPSNLILLTPNICAELFSWDQCTEHRLYITKRLIGAIYPGETKRIEDLNTLWRQAYRKIYALERSINAPLKLFFFYDREPNCIYQRDGESWRFHNNSPIYKRLLKLYKTLSKL